LCGGLLVPVGPPRGRPRAPTLGRPRGAGARASRRRRTGSTRPAGRCRPTRSSTRIRRRSRPARAWRGRGAGGRGLSSR
jgi:hypothetical protein